MREKKADAYEINERLFGTGEAFIIFAQPPLPPDPGTCPFNDPSFRDDPLAEVLRDQDKGLPIVGERQTVEQFLAMWLESMRPTIRLSTWIRYEQLVRLHLIPTIGRLQLSKLTAQQVQALYSTKLKEGACPDHRAPSAYGPARRA